jgi:hypothetical protein
MFDPISYFQQLTRANVLASENGFIPVIISSIENLTGIFEEYRDNDRFVAISDTSTGNLSSTDGAYGFTKRRAYTVFILSAYEHNNDASRLENLNLCRTIFHQFVTRILVDKFHYSEECMYFDTQAIPNQEIGRFFLSGLTGLHFTLYVSEPIDLQYNPDEWNP